MLFQGDIVRLKGLSRHGKNRVREQGDLWEVMGPPIQDGRVLVRCLEDAKEKRWVHPVFDKDFDVHMWRCNNG